MTAINEPKVTEADVTRLLEWFVKHGGFVHPCVRFGQDSAGGISAFATEDIPEPPRGGIKLCACPPKLQLSHRQAPQVLCGLLPEHVLANIALIQESCRGEDSLWAPYIKCLPKADQLTTPIYFKEERTQAAALEKRNDTVWLLGTNLDKAWRARETQWKEEFEQSRKAMEMNGITVAGYSWDLFKWAATIFTSRCFPSDPGFSKANRQYRVLLPVVDLLNHKFPTRVNWFFDNGSFQLSSEEPLVQGQEIFNNYGGKGNEELLNGYGFCIPNNPCDTVAFRFAQLPPPVVKEMTKAFGKCEPVLHVRGRNFYGGLYPVTLEDYPKVTKSGIPQELWAVMEEFKKFECNGGSERAVWRDTLSARCDLLELLSTRYDNIDQWVEFPQPEPLNDKQLYAKMYRDGQMTILRENIEQLEELLLGEDFFTLEEALEALRVDSDEAVQKWETLAKSVFGTKTPRKIRERNLEEEAWMLWLCVAWLCANDYALDGEWDPERPSRIRGWINDLLDSQPFNSDSDCSDSDCSDCSDDSGEQPDSHPMFQQLGVEVWADDRAGLALFEWATRTARAEARVLDLLNDHEKSGKMVVCMEEM